MAKWLERYESDHSSVLRFTRTPLMVIASEEISRLRGLIEKEAALTELFLGSDQKEASGEAITLANARSEAHPAQKTMNLPTADAVACFRMDMATGPKQEALAKLMTKELKRNITQGQVSRWLKHVREWNEAGNVPPDLPKPLREKPKDFDPANIDLGARLDHRTERQRDRRSDDSDD